MRTLKGQNFRILTIDDSVPGNYRYRVIGMATGCTVTLVNNTQNGGHKDVVGLAAMPEVVSQGWSVSVDSLDVADIAALLTTMKSMKKVHLVWDETSTTDNQTALISAFNRSGDAYLSDLNINFNDRETSTKTIQFTGASDIYHEEDLPPLDEYTPGSFTKGQFVRLFLSSDNTAAATSVIGAAKTLSLHVSLTMESCTTKDTTGMFDVQEPTALSFDISTSALMRSDETITSQVAAKSLVNMENLHQSGTPVKFKIANVTGANNRTASSTIVSGSVLITQLVLNGPNRQNADYTATLNGYGDYTVAA